MPDKNRIRIIKSKGREYVQAVNYDWDPVTRRGKTTVVRHLGPLRLLTVDNYTPGEIYKLKKVIANRKNRGSRKASKQELKDSKLWDIQEHNLTPPEGIVKNVLEVLMEKKQSLTRLETFNEYLVRFKTPDKDLLIIKTQVGFSLTILEREGKIQRAGKGIRGNPYRYFLRKDKTELLEISHVSKDRVSHTSIPKKLQK